MFQKRKEYQLQTLLVKIRKSKSSIDSFTDFNLTLRIFAVKKN
ncbi:MAG: hypothetical protein ACI9VN_002605 [Patescibacteria group bacterium]